MAKVAETMKEELKALKSGGKYMVYGGGEIVPVVNLRDQFAMAALQGMLGREWKERDHPSGTARSAYNYADAMLEAREQ